MGWYKLNTDGIVKRNGLSPAGGLTRDYLGHWVGGFAFNIGIYFITKAEL